MTVPTDITPIASWDGDDSEDEFTVPFLFLEDEDLYVTVTDATGYVTYGVLDGTADTDFSISGSVVTMVAAPATGETLTIYRDTPIVQPVDFVENRRFNAETVEETLDRLTLIAQELQSDVDRAIALLTA